MLVEKGKTFIGKFNKDDDLLLALNAFCGSKNIKTGVFSIIGAVQKASVGYYDQDKKVYTNNIELNKKMEIVSCQGNISLKDGKICVHAHISLSDEAGKCFGGHLIPGTVIWAAEYYIQELRGSELNRKYDSETGLSLWREE
ncbi:MAG: PPC domain-containing DNA-binding protein [Candidatus Omnitrophota bacterium]